MCNGVFILHKIRMFVWVAICVCVCIYGCNYTFAEFSINNV